MTGTAELPLHSTLCALCDAPNDADELYPATFTAADIAPAIFSARRLPDRIHYRLVRCRRCGLIRSDPVCDPELLAGLYRESTLDYGAEIPFLRKTYWRAIARALDHGARPGSLLEIGCGNGFLLEEARERGIERVAGVEASEDAVRRAPASIAPHIRCEMMRPGLFAPETFDIVAMFQLLDHLPDPNAVIAECKVLLKPGGSILSFQHDVRAWSARLLGERSPIFDIEHTYLYDRRTLAQLFERHGFEVLESGPVRNTCSLAHLVHLLPMPALLKTTARRSLGALHVDRLAVTIPLGNILAIARKPS